MVTLSLTLKNSKLKEHLSRGNDPWGDVEAGNAFWERNTGGLEQLERDGMRLGN